MRSKRATPRRVRAPIRKKVESSLAELERSELIRPLAEADPAYSFKHLLTQQAAYDSLLNSTRCELHRRVAQTYERLFPDRLDENAALLADHYAEAGDAAKTLDYATRAGDRAARLYANAEAVAQYTRALTVAQAGSDNGPVLRNLYSRRGRALELLGEFKKAEQNYREIQSLADERGDRSLKLEALILLATLYSIGGPLLNWGLAQALSERALELARANWMIVRPKARSIGICSCSIVTAMRGLRKRLNTASNRLRLHGNWDCVISLRSL